MPRTLPPPSLSPPCETRDDSNNFVASIFHEIQMAQQEGRQIKLPEEQNEDEATRLGILISEMPQLLMPLAAVEHMPTGLSEQVAFNIVL
jgi:hypothetical protein